MKIICELDGDALCIKREDFENLMESPAMFMDMTEKQIKEFKRLSDTEICMKCERYCACTGIDGLCEDCSKIDYDALHAVSETEGKNGRI